MRGRLSNGVLALATAATLSACATTHDGAFPPLGATPPASMRSGAVLSEFANGVQPGCVMGCFGPAGRVTTRSAGYDRLVGGKRLDEHTRFLVASMSKQFTALSILILAEQGKLRLEDRASRWLPELTSAVDDATIEELLHQTAGVRDHVNLLFLSGVGALARVDRAQTFALLARQQRTNFPPGTRAQYSNGNYFVLAEIVERASGQALATFAQREIFTPIGMDRTGFLDAHEAIALADGHEPAEGGRFRVANDRPATHGSGGVVTTVADIARFDRAFRAGKGPWTAALKARFLVPGRLRSGEVAVLPEFGTAYGAGVGLSPVGTDLQIEHDGGAEGFRSQYVRMRDAPLAVAVLCNRVDANASAMAKTALSELRGVAATSPSSASPQSSAAPRAETPAPQPPDASLLARLAGDYRADELSTAYRLTAVGDGFEVEIHSPYTAGEGSTETWGGLTLESPGVIRSGPLRLDFVEIDGRATLRSLSFGKRVEGIALVRAARP